MAKTVEGKKVGAQCIGVVKDTADKELFIVKRHYAAELDSNDILILKDKFDGMRRIPKETWKTCFKITK